MSIDNTFNKFSENKSWRDKVFEADQIWAEVKALLATQGQTLPATPRRPDVRMIINNISGMQAEFLNPGDHSAGKQEVIPFAGDKCAVMVMVKGETLEEQYQNAADLYQRYDLGCNGLSELFLQDLKRGHLADQIAEAYGPAPFAGQSEKLVDVTWHKADKTGFKITPVHGSAAAYGARAAVNELVFLAQFEIRIKGTGTVPERVESDGLNIAVTQNSKTGIDTTRPIAPSVAKVYYGEHFSSIPVVQVNLDGSVEMVEIKGKAPVSASYTATSKPAAPPPPAS